MHIMRGDEAVEKWGIYEIVLQGPRDGNPFAEVSVDADFRFKNRVVTCRGFYDGDGVYRVRFMPDAEGVWEYSTRSDVDSLNGHTGRFDCVSPSEGNHGPVRVHHQYHFASMPAEVDDAYLRYVVARLASFRNVWWSMANEWDFMKTKSANDFGRFFRIVQEEDPYGHLRSIHNGYVFYDHSRQWVTHLSVQRNDLETVSKWRSEYGKPVIVDECGYEGNIDRRWGNLPGTDSTTDSSGPHTGCSLCQRIGVSERISLIRGR